MGSGSFSADAYAAASTFRSASGIADFAYSASTRRRERSEWKAEPTLSPLNVTRESRDSEEHPQSTPIVVLFDDTGSMGHVPMILQKKLPDLFGLLLRKGYVTDPQILMGAVGDADYDQVPLQVGQFESDNKIDDQLRLLFLEGGGGDGRESYELSAYFVANHTVTDAWEKRGKKGYFFIIGDDKNKPVLQGKHIARVLGDSVQADVEIADIYRDVQERWETFYIAVKPAYGAEDHWRKLLGQHVLKLEDPAAVCELIATTIGLYEDAISLDEGLADLTEIGSSAVGEVGRALATVGAGKSSGSVATLPPDLAGADDI